MSVVERDKNGATVGAYNVLVPNGGDHFIAPGVRLVSGKTEEPVDGLTAERIAACFPGAEIVRVSSKRKAAR